MLFIIALLTAITTAILSHSLFSWAMELELEKKFKDTFGRARFSPRRGTMKSLFFAAEKTGNYLAGKNIAFLNLLSREFTNHAASLGEPYASMEPYTFIGFQLIFSILSILFAVVLCGVYNPVLLLGTGVLVFLIPLFMIKERVREKHNVLFRQLPDFIDMLTLMIEAGIDFNIAINKIIGMDKGSLTHEFSLYQQEVKLGKSRVEALKDMAGRVRNVHLSNVVGAITLSLTTGSSLAATLRTISAQLRTERIQLAEKKAGEAPVKLMLPLAFLIFPTIFIILFGPIFLSFISGK